jgi:hypothetical protein
LYYFVDDQDGNQPILNAFVVYRLYEITYTGFDFRVKGFIEQATSFYQNKFQVFKNGLNTSPVSGGYQGFFTAPPTSTSITVDIVSAGGGGGSGSAGTQGSTGGTGAYNRVVLPVTPGTIYTVLVGAYGGKGGSSHNGYPGNPSSITYSGGTFTVSPGGGGNWGGSGGGTPGTPVAQNPGFSSVPLVLVSRGGQTGNNQNTSNLGIPGPSEMYPFGTDTFGFGGGGGTSGGGGGTGNDGGDGIIIVSY